MRVRIAFYLLLLLIAGVAGLASYRWQLATTAGPELEAADNNGAAFDDVTGNVLQGMERPDFSLPDLEGKMHRVSEWDGKVLIVNFWATWCPPCRKEIPMFVQLQQQYKEAGLQFVGIAIDDPKAVSDFLAHSPINYPVLVSEDQGIAAAKAYGNNIGALPFSAVVDRSRHIVFTRPGELERELAERMVKTLLKP